MSRSLFPPLLVEVGAVVDESPKLPNGSSSAREKGSDEVLVAVAGFTEELLEEEDEGKEFDDDAIEVEGEECV